MAEQYRHLDDEFFDVDPLTRTKQRIVIDNDGVIHFETKQDTTEIRQYAHEYRSQFAKNERIGDMAKVGSIPMLVMYDLIKRGIWFDPERRKRWWNSVEAAPYKTRDIRL